MRSSSQVLSCDAFTLDGARLGQTTFVKNDRL